MAWKCLSTPKARPVISPSTFPLSKHLVPAPLQRWLDDTLTERQEEEDCIEVNTRAKNRGGHKTISSLSAPLKRLPWHRSESAIPDTLERVPLLFFTLFSPCISDFFPLFAFSPSPSLHTSLHTPRCSSAPFTSHPSCSTSHSFSLIVSSPIFTSFAPPILSSISSPLLPVITSPPPFLVFLCSPHAASLNRACCLNGRTC